MRIIGFSEMWPKLQQDEFTTFRLPRKDTDWHIGERVLCFYRPRSKDRKFLCIADIMGKEDRTFVGAANITDEEAIADGFPQGTSEMLTTMTKMHPGFNALTVLHKLTLRKVPQERLKE